MSCIDPGVIQCLLIGYCRGSCWFILLPKYPVLRIRRDLRWLVWIHVKIFWQEWIDVNNMTKAYTCDYGDAGKQGLPVREWLTFRLYSRAALQLDFVESGRARIYAFKADVTRSDWFQVSDGCWLLFIISWWYTLAMYKVIEFENGLHIGRDNSPGLNSRLHSPGLKINSKIWRWACSIYNQPCRSEISTLKSMTRETRVVQLT